MTEAAFAFGVAALYAAYWMRERSRKPITTSEWLERMRALKLGVK